MKKIVQLMFIAVMPLALSGFGKPEHSKVVSSFKVAKSGKAEMVFKVEANPDMTITFDAPWHLKLKKHDGLDVEAVQTKEMLDQALPGFKVVSKAAPSAKKGEVDYKLTAFICTKDKTRCYREVHKGKLSWAAP